MTKGEDQSRSISFAWSDFKNGKPLNEIPVREQRDRPLESRASGTDVQVLGLLDRAQWDNPARAESVVAKLATLITPFRQFKDFRVRFSCDGRPIELQDLAAQALNYASAKFTASWDGNQLKLQAWFAPILFRGTRGEAQRQLYNRLLASGAQRETVAFLTSNKLLANRKPESLVNQPGGWLFTIKESISLNDLKAADLQFARAADPGSFEAELYYFLFNEETTSLLSAAGLSATALQNMSRVGIFRDGFRVRTDDDWLQLSEGTTTGSFFQLRPKNVLGFFALSNAANPALIEKSDREGFVDNDAWRGFLQIALRIRKFANDSLEASRNAYAAYVKHVNAEASPPPPDLLTSVRHSQEQARTALDTMGRHTTALRDRVYTSLNGLYDDTDAPTTKARLQELRNEVATLYEELETSVAQARSSSLSTTTAVSRLADEQSALSERNLRLIDAAAVGLSARTLAHEMSTFVQQIERGVPAASRGHRDRNDAKFTAAVAEVTGGVRELKKIVTSIDPLLPGSRTLKDTFRIGDAVREFVELRHRRLTELGISIEVVGGTGSAIRFSRTQFNRVLENLLQNSLHWLRTSDSKLSKKAISVAVGGTTLRWSDTGPGVREAIEDSIFEPYVSDKVGEGQGLGLFIVTAFLHAERCAIVLGPERNAGGRRYQFIVDFTGAFISD